MSRFINKEAKETAGLSSDSDSLSSDEGSDLSENDVIPLQNLANSSRAKKRKAPVLQDYSDSAVEKQNLLSIRLNIKSPEAAMY